MTADTHAPLWDFAEDFRTNPEPALCRLQALLLDRRAVLRRVAELRALADDGAAEFAGSNTGGTDLADAVALVCGARLLPQYREGRLTEKHVWQLHRLTCDADALPDAHRRLVAEDAAAPATVEVPTTAYEETRFGLPVTGFTLLARTGRLADLEERLRPWLPFLLRRTGLTADLDEALARQFLSFLRGRMADVQHHGFRDLFPVWVQDFAQARGAAGTLHAAGLNLSPADVEADAVERVLRRPGEGESPWAKSYREAALHTPVRTARDLLTFETPHVREVSCLPNYRRDLFLEARQVLRDGLELFECAASSR